MSLAGMIRSAVMRRWADPARLARDRARAEAARRRDGRPHEVDYFHQPDDPYSHLAAQALKPFLARFAVVLKPHVVARPTPVAIHDQALWDAWSRRECAAMAPYYGFSYEPRDATPDPAHVTLARRILLALEGSIAFPGASVAIGAALHAGDGAQLATLAQVEGAVPEADAATRLQANFDLRHRLGHYLGAMFHYEGEWYWGVDRLPHLEARLESLGARRKDAPIGPSAPLTRRAPARMNSGRRVTLELFASLRSPYSHLAYGRVADLVQRYPVDLVCRPVIPMMMRGVKADRRKGEYIIRDTKREADRLGIPFGDIWDPFGDPVKRAYSLFPWARDRGKGFEYLWSYSRAVWGERVDAWSHAGLQMVVERAGLSWAEARARLDNRDWEPELEQNVQDMIAAGSWGVPTLRLPAAGSQPPFTAWGQDRIWLVEEEIARRLGP
jgi:2-hydroxychromene-2-carboxylate isomerase